jgi:glycosyltransferase involved in cell wall biosynthesis
MNRPAPQAPDSSDRTDHEPLRIAEVAPLFESVPPRLYGGTERIVSYLTEELVRQGNHVTLFASGDSVTSAELVSICEQAIRLDPREPDPSALHVLLLEEVHRRAASFDVIHYHTDNIHLNLARREATPTIVTLHGRLDTPGLDALYREFDEIPLISISHAQRRPLASAHWLATVYHGLPLELHPFSDGPGKYLAFLGRIAPEKGVDDAIRIARAAGIPLRIAAKVDPADRDYFAAEIEPLIEEPAVRFIGEIDETQKSEFLGNAAALLFPIRWPEPFGLVMIEAMACGTPVIAYRRGSVPEIIDEGVTGLIVESPDEAIDAVQRVRDLDRQACRKRFERRFSATVMASGYRQIYAALLQEV